MTRRNDLRRATAGTQILQQLGYCLSSLGVLSTTLAYSQPIANAQTSPSAVASPVTSRTVPTLPVIPANIAPPEVIVTPEVTPAPAATLEVPAATVAVPTPTPESLQAADLLPTPADNPPPVEVELIQTPQPVVPPVNLAPTTKPSPAANKAGLAKPTAKQAPTTKQTPTTQTPTAQAPTAKQAPTAPQAIAPIVKPAVPIADIPVVQAEINPAPAAEPVQVGPINLSRTGISFNPTAIPPYFNPQLRLPPMPGLDSMRMGFPIAIPAPITSLFGWRVHPISGTQRLHTGTDIGAPMGAPVMASLGGRVILADNMGGYGITVAIEHDNGIRQTLYAHMSDIFVRPGDIVQQGTVIGRVGSTGASTGPHLHFELRQMLPDGTWVAQDASQHLERSMAQLVQSLQIAQQPQKTAMKPVQIAR